ncbi:cyclic pyranopterin phosphate synthase [Clostridium sp. DSM 8431]|uniref:GTP 3',8-cyclase MoaA n=1 Tax=Clostridium sp. DSM 8431 TaxID=1761781 RepID=UPI0008ED59BF|nr:GTP 3',8-cyclase MoaA [Clostridium sp. DSM 8431]SFU57456.1 cyclic pyranopterin phosphate synthase [Clostridium sp. DSM 8431]
MKDIFNRNIDYIRISITDRCNLRCVYCMPEEGITLTEHEKILTYEEIIRLCREFAKLGISKVKITGGEPLVRRNLKNLIKSIKDIEGIDNVTLTTNGILLEDQIDGLVKAGLDAVNISIDTLDKEKFKSVTRVGDIDKVLKSIDKCLTYENLTVKINCVPIKGENDKEILDIVNLAKDKNLSVRFIELMPIGLGREMKGYTDDEIKKIIEEHVGVLKEYKGKLGNGPSTYYSLENFKGKIGFISAVNHKFCDSCNRVRLTSDGFLKKCLQYETGSDLKKLLREGKSDDEIIRVIEETIYNKPESHMFSSKDKKEHIEIKGMSQIGG